MITETELVHLALRLDLFMLKNNCYAGEEVINDLIADWLINNQIQTL